MQVNANGKQAVKIKKIMQPIREKYGRWALIAGAAEGVGEGFAITLAEQKCNLILVDINDEALTILGKKLIREYGIETKTLCLDLGEPHAAGHCLALSRSVEAQLLICVAAYSKVQPFLTLTSDDLDRFIRINCQTNLHLIHGFATDLKLRNLRGGIILISSLAGLLGPQYVAAYAATKAFLIRLAESLSPELASHGIDIMACPLGTTMTPAFRRSNPKLGVIKPHIMQPAQIARQTLRQLGRKTIFIPGMVNRWQTFVLQHLMPRRMAGKIVNMMMRKMYGA